MNDTANKRWWLPSALFALAGMLFLVPGVTSGRPVWITLGLVLLTLALVFAVVRMNLRRQAPRRDKSVPSGDSGEAKSGGEGGVA
jgi:UPF0716 family protein affecting phage T7 exclusion